MRGRPDLHPILTPIMASDQELSAGRFTRKTGYHSADIIVDVHPED